MADTITPAPAAAPVAPVQEVTVVEQVTTPTVPEVEATHVVEPVKVEKPVVKPTAPVDAKLGKVTGLVEAAGLTMQEVAKIAKANEGKLDTATMLALTEKHGEAVASLLADQIENIHATRTSEAAQRDQAVFDQVAEAFKGQTEQSGEESWKELAGWAKDNVSTEHRAEINALLAQGGLAAKLAVQELTTAFKESQQPTEYQDAELLVADTTAKSDSGNITKQDYIREMNKLLADGHEYGSSSEMAKLDARRTRSINRGI